MCSMEPFGLGCETLHGLTGTPRGGQVCQDQTSRSVRVQERRVQGQGHRPVDSAQGES